MKHTFISKTDLAQAYFPYINPASARNKLMSLITSSATLISKLRDTGYTDRQKEFSPLQAEMITEYFGNPFR